MRTIGLIIIIYLFFAFQSQSQSNDNLLPPMGWEPWNIDHCGNSSNWDADYYMQLADFFVSSGLKDLGYNYLTIECYSHNRDSLGRLQPNRLKFPNGFKPVTDYIHSKGLKVRAYTDAGEGTCGCFEGAGSLGHYYDDAKSWVEWGFDGVKIDWCGGDKILDPETQYTQFAQAIRHYSKSFHIEICCWGKGAPWLWGRNVGTMWRTSSDIDYHVRKTFDGGDWKILLRNIDFNDHGDPKYVGPGKGWNYPDMLIVGHPKGLSELEERTMFGMWAMMASPLFLSNDVMNMPKYVKDIVMNKEIIAIDQDSLGIQGSVVLEFPSFSQIWLKDLIRGEKAIAVLNRSEKTEKITLKWNELGISGIWKVRDLWEHADKGVFAEEFTVSVQAHEAIVLRLSK